MGGVVPIGYNVEERKLVINPADAETVRTLFQHYLERGNVTQCGGPHHLDSETAELS